MDFTESAITVTPGIHESPRKRSYPSDDALDALTRTAAPLRSMIEAPTSPHSTDSPDHTHSHSHSHSHSHITSLPNGQSREPSPALSTSSSLTSICTMQVSFGLDGTVQSTPGADGAPAAKRRKLTPGEKLERQREKAEKDRVRVEEKARRDEEKARKDEEKQVKDEERRQKAEEREEKKRERDLQKQKKIEEEERKKKTQPPIKNFFMKPAPPTYTQPNTASPSSRSTSVDPGLTTLLPKKPATSLSDYDRFFLPFSPPSHSTCAPIISFSWDEESLRHLEEKFDEIAQHKSMTVPRKIHDFFSPLPWESVASRPVLRTAVEMMSHLNELSATPEAMEELRSLQMKHIYFDQDVRPPYVGTYSKRLSNRVIRNPFLRVRPDTDYDYDSEAEWEEPEEGEDLDSEAESDAESVETNEEMEEFLDDEDTGGTARKKTIIADLQPISTGVCWEDERGHLIGDDSMLRSFRLVVINDTHQLPLDPYSTAYWVDSMPVIGSTPLALPDNTSSSRLPLQLRPNQSTGIFGVAVIDNNQTKSKSAKAPKGPARLLSGVDLQKFKDAVKGSPHTKTALIDILKKEVFPTIPKTVLKDTLESFAAQHGTSADKRWIIVDNGTHES